MKSRITCKVVTFLSMMAITAGLTTAYAFADMTAAEPMAPEGLARGAAAGETGQTASGGTALSANGLTPNAVIEVHSWDELQGAIDSDVSGQDGIRLGGDLNGEGKDCITIDGKTVAIDLNGHKLDRKRVSASGTGHVIELMNQATLHISDSSDDHSGTITGGYAQRGGGIYIDDTSTCEIYGGTITRNHASVDGGGIYVKGTLIVSGDNGKKPAIIENSADDTGGGIFVSDTGTIKLDGADVSHNNAKNAGGGINLHLKDNSSTIANSTIGENTSKKEHGGGIRMDAKQKTLDITNTNIDGNTSIQGGGIYIKWGSINMTGGSISSNTSANGGGGVYVTEGTSFTANDILIEENKAEAEEGGGVRNYGKTTLTDCKIQNNKAKKRGGGVFNDERDGGEGSLSLRNCTFELNRTNKDGGGVYSDKTLAIDGGKVTKNYAETGKGNGICIGGGSDSVSIKGGLVVKDNDPSRNGQEIFLCGDKKLSLSGLLAVEACIGVTMENGKGIFTDGYSTDNSGISPDEYFFSPEGFDIALDDDEEEAQLVSSWDDLKNEIENAADGGIVTLAHDYTASSDDARLTVFGDKSITINLNGHTLNRNRSSGKAGGQVLGVLDTAKLTIKDENASGEVVGAGTITGGWASQGGGAYVDKDATLTIEGGTITDNNSNEDGAGVYVDGTLIMTGGAITGNTAYDTGGGIYASDTGTIKLSNADISHNNATNAGGGINLHLKDDSSAIANCTITENKSLDDCGGGIRMDAKDRKLEITGSTIDNNVSGKDGAGIYLHWGAIDITGGSLSGNVSGKSAGGVMVTKSTVLTATNVNIGNNKANKGQGGGVKNNGEATLTTCTIEGNSATEQGGGVFNDNDGSSAGELTLDGCTVSDNTADGDGGGVYSDHKLNIRGGSITGNVAQEKGGGILVDGDAKITDIKGAITATGNEAVRGKDLFLQSGRKLTLSDKITNTNIGNLDMAKVGVFTEKYGDHHASDAPSTFFGKADGALPAEWNKDKTEAQLKSHWQDLQKHIDDAEDGGTITLDKSYTAGSEDTKLTIPKEKTLTIKLAGHTLNRNLSSKDGDGQVIEVLENAHLTIKDENDSGEVVGTGAITGGFAKHGGGIYVDKGASLTITSGTITGNQASVDGGGIYTEGALTMAGGSIVNNQASDTGGGVYVSSDGKVALTGVDIANNTASNKGGGLNMHLGEDSTIANCTIAHNVSNGIGGGLRLDAKGKKLTITDTIIEDNTAADGGAGIYLHYGTIDMTAGSLSGNVASNDGGGIKVTSSTSFTADGVDITNNRATGKEGGGVKSFGTTTLKNCNITENNASKQGGGVFNDNDGSSAGDLTIENCTIMENATDSDGGGVYSDKKLTIKGGAVTGNTAHEKGGGVFIGKGSHDTGIEGAIVVKENTAAAFGNNMYLRSGRKFVCTGALAGDAEINVDMEDGTGTLTKDYAKHNKENGKVVEPKEYFGVAKGYYVDLEGDEAEVKTHWKDLKSAIEEADNGATITLKEDVAACPSDDRIKVSADKSITVDLAGHTINRNRMDSDDDGHVFEVFGTLTLQDSSNDQAGVITGGWAKHGGGINVSKEGTLNLEGGAIAGNRSTSDGGGIYVHGALCMTGGTVRDNASQGNGGGIGLDGGSTLTLQGGTVSGNKAEACGGGINVDGDARANVEGSPVVRGNEATTDGQDVYLPKNKYLEVTAAFVDGAQVGVDTEDDWGVFTSGYNTHNQGVDPAKYFISAEGYTIFAQDDEAVLGLDTYGETEFERPFIAWNDQIKTRTDALNSLNWMSGISGERYLNEINTPGTHDSGMNNVEKLNWLDQTSVIGYFFPTQARKFAKTQNKYIDQQLAEGARQLDIRLNDCHKYFRWSIFGLGYGWTDDGENLWLCHGTDAVGGTYLAWNSDDDLLSFNQVLDWAKDFLEKHPTETIMLKIRPETAHGTHESTIRWRARKILEAEALETNPSTKEAFLYKESGASSYFAPYTHVPQLKDCRGKIVLVPVDADFISIIGGFNGKSFDNITYEDPTNYKLTGPEKVDEITREYGKLNPNLNSNPLPAAADKNGNCLWDWELNCTGQDQGDVKNYTAGDPPYVLADYVNPRLLGVGKLFGPTMAGQYIGWVRMDSLEAKYAEAVWRTNYSDDLQYCTVTVKSNLVGSYTDQVYRLLKGTNISIPGNIYKQVTDGKYLGSWKAEGANESASLSPGESFKLEEDVTFTADWLDQGTTPVRIVWDDGDDADKLRPHSVNLAVQGRNGTFSTVTLTVEKSWGDVVTGDVASIVPNSGLIVPTRDHPYGQDAEQQYRYDLIYEYGSGYTFTFHHTPQAKIGIAGVVEWDDNDNLDGLRPANVTVRLLANGVEKDSKQVSADNGWQYDFGEYAQYENCEKIEYSIAEDAIEGYRVVVDEFSVVNMHTVSKGDVIEAKGLVEWDDSENTKGVRPEKVLVHLKVGDEEIDSLEVSAGETGLWLFSFGDVPVSDSAGQQIAYTLTVDQVSGYTTSVDDSGAPAFRVTCKLDVSPNEKDPAVIKTEPEFYQLIYDGEAQSLAKGGSGSGGAMLYALGTDEVTVPEEGAFSEAIPTAADAGTYHIWYYAKGDAFHTDTEPVHMTATISKAAPEFTAPVAKEGLVANGQAQELVETGSTADGTVVYALGASGTTAPEAGAFGEAVPTATGAGTYHVWYKVVGDALHADTEPVCVEVTIGKKPGPGESDSQDRLGRDGTAVGPGASAAVAERAILALKGDVDPAGSRIAPLKLTSVKKTSKTAKKAKGAKKATPSVKLSWAKLASAAKYVVYGGKSGKGSKMAKIVTTPNNALKVKTIAGQALKEGAYYKFIVVALDASDSVVSTSKVVYAATKGGKVGNYKKVTVKKAALKKAKKLKAGKKLKLKAKAVPKSKKLKVKRLAKMRYESSNPKVATVSAKGVVEAKGKGKCYVYAYAQNGAIKKVTVKVK